jgi:hypothetical protein
LGRTARRETWRRRGTNSAENSPDTFRRACIDPVRDGHTVLFARTNLT